MRKLHPFICLTHTHTNLHRRGGFREEEETVIVSPLHPTTSTLPLPPVIVILISCGGNLIFLCALCALPSFPPHHLVLHPPPPPLRMCVCVCAGCCLIVIVLLPKSASLPTPLPAALSDLNFIIYRYIFIYETIQWGKMRKNKTLKV